MAEFLEIRFNSTTQIPAGMMAAIVTSLDMRSPAPRKPDPALSNPPTLVRLRGQDSARYLSIYRVLGQRWMWFSRLILPFPSIVSILDDPRVMAFCVVADGTDIGLLELDFRAEGECELAFFGLVEAAIGKGVGRWLMNRALELAWAQPISRLWVHTCTFDHPGAIAFYRNSGFAIFRIGIEIADDPRLSGHLPPHAAPHVPLLA